MSDFPDHFSRLAKAYAQYRPGYPERLFDRIAEVVPRHEVGWDCATGNGQAALPMAARFDRVIATDASADQIAHGTPHDRIEYRVEQAEQTTIPSGSVDAVQVAAALHWFDLDRFVDEVRRVARPGAALAAWTYTTNMHATAPIEAVVDTYVNGILGPYWTTNHQVVQDRYQTIALPFEPIPCPELEVEVAWTFPQLLGILGTWSAAGLYMQAQGQPATDQIRDALVRAWELDRPLQEPRRMRLPLAVRLARIHPE